LYSVARSIVLIPRIIAESCIVSNIGPLSYGPKEIDGFVNYNGKVRMRDFRDVSKRSYRIRKLYEFVEPDSRILRGRRGD
jgi:hypothetical protein